MHAGQFAADGGKDTAHLGGSIRLGINHVHLRRSAIEMDVDDRLARGTDAGGFLRTQEIGQRESAQAHRASR